MTIETEQIPVAAIMLYRSMKPDGEHPSLGRTHTSLGVIVEGPRREVEADHEGYVDPGPDGMSVTPYDPRGLPVWRLPKVLGGTGAYDLWCISADGLPEGLEYRPDPKNSDRHGTIVPARRMTLDQYEDLLSSTRLSWQRVIALPQE
jgi:hypothetical protein